VNDNNINEEWFAQHQRQPDMPSADEAWSDMHAKLDKEMPVDNVIVETGKGKVLPEYILYLIVVLLLLLNIKHTNESLNTKQANTPVTESLPVNASAKKQKQVSGLGNAIPPLVATEIKGNNSKHKEKLQLRSTIHYELQAEHTSITKKDNSAVEESKPIIYDTVESTADKGLAIADNDKTNTQKSKLATMHPTDSSQNNDDEDEEKLLVQAGLQWTVPIPIAGTSNYFAGPSGKNQPWRMLLPGAWVSVQADKNILMAEVNPFEAASFNPKAFYSNKEADSLMVLETSKSITKVFGISGAVSFQHNIAGNWWAGAGLQVNFWSKGLAVLTVNEHNGATNTTSSSSHLYELSKEDWQYFSKMQLYPHLQFMYRTNSYQTGLRTGITFTSLAQDAGAKNLGFAELFFRLPLISNGKK
jgi:hypothetical protein